jgi:hypothetical protein
MTTIKAHFDGKALIPEEPVELPQNCTLIVHVEAERERLPFPPVLRPVLFPSDQQAARRLIRDAEEGQENF